MVMYLNGKNQGVAYEDVFDGVYYPAISLYKNATVTVNFGPRFRYPPKDQVHYRPLSSATDDASVQQALGDILYHIEHEGQQPEF
jgi:Set1/Ash2 histone methyltransferase complex subunit ASH2